MFKATFEQFLMAQGLVTASQVLDAKDKQKERRPMIGLIAQQEGILSMTQTMDVVSAQAEKKGLRFGEVAIELGFLTQEQLDYLLKLQQAATPTVEELLVEMRALTLQQLKEAREKSQSRSDLS